MNIRFLSFLLPFLFLLTTNCRTTSKVYPNQVDFTKVNDIRWASPRGFDLTMDIFTPNTGKKSYPVIVIFHGGGWLINNKNVMEQSAAYLAKSGNYVVCNVNYRLLGDLENTVTLNEIVEDAFGSVLWIKENIVTYKGDASKIIVTGDSAGGHLATMVATQGDNLSSEGFNGKKLAFTPSYLPKGKTAEDIAKENGLAVQAAMISYGAFDLYAVCLDNFEKASNIFWMLGKTKPRSIFGKNTNVKENANLYQQVSPTYNIPDATKKLPPMLFTVGSKDNLTTPASIEAYIALLKKNGHSNIEYWVHEGRPHAFLDSGSNVFLGITFEKDAPLALDKMLGFLDSVFYKK